MLLNNSNSISAEDSYVIERSLRIPTSSYLLRTPSQQGNLRNWTLSFWIKRASFGDQIIFGALYQQVNVLQVQTQLGFGANGELYCIQYNSNLGYQANIVTSAFLRDPSSWYHVTYVWDTPNAIASDRVRIYLNGERVSTFSSASYPTQNLDGWINNISTTPKHGIGILFDNGPAQSGSGSINGYLAEFNFIDGQSLDSSNFGKINTLTNQWVAKKYTGTYGTNGFYLDFKDGTSTTTISQDKSGNNNNWTPFNFTRSAGVNDCWMLDVPSGNGGASAVQPSSNYSTLDPVFAGANSLSKSNLTVTYTSASIAYSQLSNFTVSGGNWYYEANLSSFSVGDGANNVQSFGYRSRLNINSRIEYGWRTDGSIMRHSLIYNLNGSLVQRINIDTVAPVSTDIFSLAFDIDLGIIKSYKNGVQTAQISGILNVGDWTPSVTRDGSSNAATWNFNYGQRSFAYTPPAGFKALCTANLPTPTIAKPNKYFDILTYTGDGTTNRSFSSMQFSPDLVWIKHRSGTISHGLWNSNVGGGVNKGLATDRTVNEASAGFDDTNGYLTTFDSNGFSVKTGVYTNNNATPYVAWQWRASDLPAVINNVGSIVSTVSVNPTAGFSIVTHTNSGVAGTIGHGLGKTPKFIITRVRNRTENWRVYFGQANKLLILNSTNAEAIDTTIWNNTQPTSDVFSIGTYFSNGDNIVSYCFAEIEGYSKFGSYVGNGSTDGAFIYLGFRPKFLLLKCTDTAGRSWPIFDSSRTGYNPDNNEIFADLANAENTADMVDFLSNGFKFRSSDTFINASGSNYIFLAFAETPFQYSNAR